MPRHAWLLTCVLTAAALTPTVARAGDGDDPGDPRAAMIARLLDVDVGDAGVTWSALEEGCGLDCEYVAWGGCWLDAGAADCEVKVYDASTRKTRTVKARDANHDPDARARAVAELDKLLANVGENPVWLTEHRFETPPVDVATWNVTFKWNWKKLTVTVFDGKKKKRAVKAPRLRKGLGVSSAAIWYTIAEDGSAGHAVLRVHGEGDEGEVGEATAVVELPGLHLPQQ
ncbi:MAG: hypothetical protein IPL61_30795 [Myxococcales bacterium]|nr:hypothetical protein [Myxococcales bacterium]